MPKITFQIIAVEFSAKKKEQKKFCKQIFLSVASISSVSAMQCLPCCEFSHDDFSWVFSKYFEYFNKYQLNSKQLSRMMNLHKKLSTMLLKRPYFTTFWSLEPDKPLLSWLNEAKEHTDCCDFCVFSGFCCCNYL